MEEEALGVGESKQFVAKQEKSQDMTFRIVVPSRQLVKVIELKEEVKRILSVSFMIGQFMEMVD